MNKDSGDGIIFNGGLAILMLVACLSFGGQLKQTGPKSTNESSTAPCLNI